MGKTYSILKKDLLEANSLFSDDNFYKATGMRLNFMLIGRMHSYSKEKNKIQVDELKDSQPPKTLGIILPSKIRCAIRIGQHILSLSKIQTATEDEDKLCCICLERNIDILLICGHGYCEQDILDWKDREENCPLCRRKLNNNQMYYNLGKIFF